MSKKTAVISGSTAALALLALAGFGDLDGMTNGMPDWRPPEPDIDPAYDALANAAAVAAAGVRKARRNAQRLWAHAPSLHNGKQVRGPGFVFRPVAQARPDVPASTRAERRRAKLGRA